MDEKASLPRGSPQIAARPNGLARDVLIYGAHRYALKRHCNLADEGSLLRQPSMLPYV